MGKWLKIHQQKPHDTVQFSRQRHGGSAWDDRRHRLLLFGSDTHEKNWDNSLYYFELDRLHWQRAYKPDIVASYRVDGRGIPVAGERGNRPWAMHTFDAINYQIKDDVLVVASSPDHLEPGRFGNWFKSIWGSVKKHPTWIYSFRSNDWRVAQGKAVSFFPYASAYDTDRDLVVGFRPFGVFEFLGENEGWNKVGKRGPRGWHTQAVYDNKHKLFVFFGNNKRSNDVYTYKLGEKRALLAPTVGLQPPGASSPPLAFNSKIGKVVALIDAFSGERGTAQTWLYDAGEDRWERAFEADFPFKLGMNYNLQYSNSLDVLILFANAPKEPSAVWVLRLEAVTASL